MSRKDRNAGDPARAPEHGRGTGGTEAPRRRGRWPLPRLILLFGALLLAAGLGVSLIRDMSRAPAPVSSSTGVAAVGGPFQLVDQDGRTVDQSILQGRWTAMFFGYTYCPDVCPATLSALKVVKERLGDEAKDLQVVFVSIDPQRDTPAQLKTYLSSPAFPQPNVGLTGTPEQVATVAKAYRVYYARNGTGDDYLMDHSSAIYLIGPDGKFRTLLSDSEGLDSLATGLASALGRG